MYVKSVYRKSKKAGRKKKCCVVFSKDLDILNLIDVQNP